MKIILNSDVSNLGRRGDIVEVADGFARNFLIPKHLAILATKGALRQAEGMQKARGEKERKEREEAETLAGKISRVPLKIGAKVGEDGHLFGSITTSDIAGRLTSELGEEIDRRRVHLVEPIRSAGTHEFEVQVHSEVKVKGTVEVVPE